MDELLTELMEALQEDEGVTTSNEQLAEYGAYINWLSPQISIKDALYACLEEDDCWDSLVAWIKNPARPKAGCQIT